MLSQVLARFTSFKTRSKCMGVSSLLLFMPYDFNGTEKMWNLWWVSRCESRSSGACREWFSFKHIRFCWSLVSSLINYCQKYWIKALLTWGAEIFCCSSNALNWVLTKSCLIFPEPQGICYIQRDVILPDKVALSKCLALLLVYENSWIHRQHLACIYSDS